MRTTVGVWLAFMKLCSYMKKERSEIKQSSAMLPDLVTTANTLTLEVRSHRLTIL